MQNTRISTPTVLQMEAVECGAASLSMILSYYGKFLPLEKIREDCNVNRDGSSASNIIKAGINYGLKAKGFKNDIDSLLKQKFPVIIHWNFNHFLVLEGFKKDKIYLNDPAIGHRTVTVKELSKSFTGVVLTFEITKEFVKSGKKSNLWANIFERIKGYEKVFAFLILIGLLLVIPGLVVPVFVKIFIDDILIGGLNDWFIPLIIGMLLTTIFKTFLEYLKLKYLLKARSKLDIISTAKYFWHVIQLPMGFFNQRYSGEVGSRFVLNAKIAQLITNDLARNFLNIIVLIFFFILMLQYDILLTFIGVILSLLNVVALKVISKKRVEGYHHYTLEEGKLLSVSMAGLQHIETLKAMGRENDFFVKWAGYFVKVANSKQKLAILSVLLSSIPVLLSSLINVTILVIGALKVMEGKLTMGMLVAFQSLMASFYAPIESLINIGGEIQEAEGDMNRLRDVLNNKVDKQIKTKTEFTEESFPLISKKLEGFIEFRNVTFGYNKLGKPLINNFDLKLTPGQRIALVGGSGSGKSTIAKLLIGFYEPWEGEILLDGIPKDKIARQVVNNSLALVSQEIFLFEGSARDVLTLWDKTISDQMIIEASKDACIHEVLSSKPNGYDYILNESGKNFSGGQRQRIEIARALITNPSMIILDEATSALDPTTEKNVMDNIKRRKCSVLVVAHRLSTIRDCNEIIVMSNGNIVERGTHNELLKLNGEYSRLIKM